MKQLLARFLVLTSPTSGDDRSAWPISQPSLLIKFAAVLVLAGSHAYGLLKYAETVMNEAHGARRLSNPEKRAAAAIHRGAGVLRWKQHRELRWSIGSLLALPLIETPALA